MTQFVGVEILKAESASCRIVNVFFFPAQQKRCKMIFKIFSDNLEFTLTPF